MTTAVNEQMNFEKKNAWLVLIVATCFMIGLPIHQYFGKARAEAWSTAALVLLGLVAYYFVFKAYLSYWRKRLANKLYQAARLSEQDDISPDDVKALIMKD